jgi:hypothetical protein
MPEWFTSLQASGNSLGRPRGKVAAVHLVTDDFQALPVDPPLPAHELGRGE